MDEQEEPKMREYCVTGGTGLIGSYLVKSLLDKGYNMDEREIKRRGLSALEQGVGEGGVSMGAKGSEREAEDFERYRHDATQLSPLNESHWTDLDYCKRYNLWYAYAKTMAEQEAWKWADEQNGGIELVVVNLSFVVGPLLTPQPTSTLQLILAIVKGLIGEYPNKRVGFVHIEDAVVVERYSKTDLPEMEKKK
nr:tetraketide alpha-pyrone reductase 2-like [Ipomoea batatas]